jgi:transcription antitermination factor NusG
MTPYPYAVSGRRGRVTSGPLAGIEGTVIQIKSPVRLVLSVELLQRSVLLEIDGDSVSPI